MKAMDVIWIPPARLCVEFGEHSMEPLRHTVQRRSRLRPRHVHGAWRRANFASYSVGRGYRYAARRHNTQIRRRDSNRSCGTERSKDQKYRAHACTTNAWQCVHTISSSLHAACNCGDASRDAVQ